MTQTLGVLGVIPARANSTRLPFKVLAEISKKPMIQRVWEGANESGLFQECFIATDHPEVERVCQAFGAKVIMTSQSLNSGTDRVYSVAKERNLPIVINIQGDEPLIQKEHLKSLIGLFENNVQVTMGTLAIRKENGEGLLDPNVVKVVCDKDLNALYFSRKPISDDSKTFLKHIGLYGFRLDTLAQFCSMPQSKLEKEEKLEQLRALENGIKIKVALVTRDTIAVDTREDLLKVEEKLKSLGDL